MEKKAKLWVKKNVFLLKYNIKGKQNNTSKIRNKI